MNRIIINADDFGLNTSVNKAIIDSFEKGLINSTTLLANRPGFDEAVELAHKHKIIAKTGIHLALTEGKPVTSNKLINDYFNDNADDYADIKMHKRKLFFLSGKGKEVIYNEFAAQIMKVRNSGIQITHIDTHHHIHEALSVTQIILTLLKKYNIPSMRILNNLNRSTRIYKSGYRIIVNKLIKLNGVNYSDFLGNQLEASWQLEKDPMFFNGKKLEVMVHPDFNQNGIIIDRIRNSEVNFDNAKIFNNHNI
jgi:chitin disaccharide deacetylase